MKNLAIQRNRAIGFSLIEILVAMTVLAVLLVILLSMVDGATRLWRESERRVDSYREARAALNLITDDLSSFYASPDQHFFSVALESSEIEDLVNGAASPSEGHALFFITSLSRSAQDPTGNRSDLCTVGYFLAFGKSSQSATDKGSYNLYRYFLSSDVTFENIETYVTARSDSPESSLPLPFFSNGSVASANIAEVEIVARNITEFLIEPRELVETTNGAFEKFESEPFEQTVTNPLPKCTGYHVDRRQRRHGRSMGQ